MHGLHLLIPDYEVTRRKRAHIIIGPSGDTEWSGARLQDAFEWLLENNIHVFDIDAEDEATYRVSFVRKLPLEARDDSEQAPLPF